MIVTKILQTGSDGPQGLQGETGGFGQKGSEGGEGQKGETGPPGMPQINFGTSISIKLVIIFFRSTRLDTST